MRFCIHTGKKMLLEAYLWTGLKVKSNPKWKKLFQFANYILRPQLSGNHGKRAKMGKQYHWYLWIFSTEQISGNRGPDLRFLLEANFKTSGTQVESKLGNDNPKVYVNSNTNTDSCKIFFNLNNDRVSEKDRKDQYLH